MYTHTHIYIYNKRIPQNKTQQGSKATMAASATHCDTLQHTATHCNTLQHAATRGNTRQHTVTHYNTI